MKRLILIFGLVAAASCSSSAPSSPSAAARAEPTSSSGATSPASSYFDNTGRTDVLAGGVRMIPIHTPKGDFRVWTKRVGNNPRIKVLLLHGGPGATHEYFEAADSFFPGASVEYYYYDQLGSAYSDQPKDTSCGTCRASSTKSNRCEPRSASTRTTSTCSATRGAAFSRSSTRSRTRITSRD